MVLKRKGYPYIDDAVDISLKITFNEAEKFEIYNIGNEDWITVKEIADIVCEVLGVKPKYVFKPGTLDGRGWPGDVKFMLLDITKVKTKYNWRPKYTSKEAVRLTAEALTKELGFRIEKSS